MKLIGLIIAINLVLLLSPLVAVAESPYGNIDIYYNEKLYPNAEIPKPILKIGEPFTLRIELTVYQKSFVNVALTELGENDFVVLEGPTNEMGEYTGLITLQENSIQIYEWKIAPTENWAGGTMPLDIHYEILDPSSPEPIVSSGFTAVRPYISTEYYEGRTTPEEPTETENKQTPAFTLPSALLAIALLATYNRHKK